MWPGDEIVSHFCIGYRCLRTFFESINLQDKKLKKVGVTQYSLVCVYIYNIHVVEYIYVCIIPYCCVDG